jgi:hypothetical protein
MKRSRLLEPYLTVGRSLGVKSCSRKGQLVHFGQQRLVFDYQYAIAAGGLSIVWLPRWRLLTRARMPQNAVSLTGTADSVNTQKFLRSVRSDG